MLNQRLYDNLRQVFKQEPYVVNEDMPGMFSCPPSKTVGMTRKNKRYAAVEDWGETYQLHCPVCRDKKQRLYVSYLNGQMVRSNKTPYLFGNLYICHNERCNLRRYFAQIPSTGVIDPKQVHEISAKPTAFVSYMAESEIPKGCPPIISAEVPQNVLDYIHKRGFSPVELDKNFMVRYAPEGTEYGDAEEGTLRTFNTERILIPIIQRRKLISWQARSVEDAWGNTPEPKYIFPAKSKKSMWLYNMDNALFHRDIVITEGLTDVWRIGPQAVALFGKKPSRHQLTILKILWGYDGRCVICLDPDAKKMSTWLEKYLRSQKIFPRGVAVAELEKGDPADHTSEEINEIITRTMETAHV